MLFKTKSSLPTGLFIVIMKKGEYELDFVHYDLGYLEEDTTVVVYLDAAANVCVLDSVNFGNYERGYSFEYLGGYVTRSPYCAVIPRDGCWNVAIDLGGYEGRIGSSVDVIPPEKIEVGLTFMGYPAKKYPNKKKPHEFTDYLFGGANNIPDGPGHGHAIIQNSTGKIVMLRPPNHKQPTIWDKSICP